MKKKKNWKNKIKKKHKSFWGEKKNWFSCMWNLKWCPSAQQTILWHVSTYDVLTPQKPKSPKYISSLFSFFFSSHQFYFSQLSPSNSVPLMKFHFFHIYFQIAKNLREKIVESKTKTNTKKMEIERSSRSTASAFFVKSFRLQFLVVLTLLLV